MLSVHSIVSMDFAVSQLPGWHTTIFPPYFVAGAIFSGFAMVITLMVICRRAFGLEQIITMRHFDYMAKIILVTGWMVGYAYGLEFFTAWYSGNPYEMFAFINRAVGRLRLGLLDDGHLQRARAAARSGSRGCGAACPSLFVVSILVNMGMWFERFVIIVTSLHRDFLPSSWGYFRPTIWDVACFVGGFGLFFTLFCLFVRFVPMVAAAEVKTVLPEASPHHHAETAGTPTERGRPARPRPSRRQLGLLAEFESPGRALPRLRARARRRATRAGTPTRPSRCTASTARWGSAARRCPGSCSSWPWAGRWAASPSRPGSTRSSTRS